MKELSEILNFVTSDMRLNPAIFQKMVSMQKDRKLFGMIHSMHHNEVATDEEAMKIVYGTVLADTVKYRVLKSRIKDRLIELMFLTDSSKALKNPFERAFFNLQRNILAAQMLILKDKRATAVSLLKNGLQTALYFNHTFSALSICKMLCYNAAYHGKPKELAKYENIYLRQLSIFQKETAIENLYNSSTAAIVKSAGYNQKTRRLLRSNFKKAAAVCNSTHASYAMMLYYHRIAVRYYHSRDAFDKVIKTARQFTAYMQQHRQFFQTSRAGEFALYEMESHIRLSRFEKGKACAQQCLRYFNAFTTPWLQFHEYYFLLAMRTANINEALRIHHTVTGSSRFGRLPRVQKERWRMHEAFLNFSLPDDLPKKNFNLFRFLNEVPLLNNDKPGYNFTILLAKIILLVNTGNYSRLIDIKTPFRDYLRRYISRKRNPRHYYFGRIMQQLFQNNFNFKKKDRIIMVYLKKLKGAKATSLPLEETEVIPYLVLWQMLKEKTEHEQWAIEDGLQMRPQIVTA
jgi:hypothetical protein